jgi:hypothetical protein
VTAGEHSQGRLLRPLQEVRKVSCAVALAVARQARVPKTPIPRLGTLRPHTIIQAESRGARGPPEA